MRNFHLIFIVLICAFSQIGCAIQPVKFEGAAMLPTLKNGDKIFIEKSFGVLKRGDIVMFAFPKDESRIFVSRIIGLPNDKVEIRNGQVFVNDVVLSEDYVKPMFDELKTDMESVQIPEGNYFVMGDNRDNSYDSRSWGLLPKDSIIGKYTMTYLSSK